MRTHYSTAAEVLKQNGFKVADSITALTAVKNGKKYVVDIDEKHTVNFKKIIGVLKGIYPSTGGYTSVHFYRTDIYVWESGEKKLLCTLPQIFDGMMCLDQLNAYLDTRDRGHGSDHSYECFRYIDGVKQERQWVLTVD